MVSVREAVAIAVKFATDLLGSERTNDIRLEEVGSDQSSGEDVWVITLSLRGDDNPSISAILGKPSSRDYKAFTVSKQTGDVLSMKIRLLAAA